MRVNKTKEQKISFNDKKQAIFSDQKNVYINFETYHKNPITVIVLQANKNEIWAYGKE